MQRIGWTAMLLGMALLTAGCGGQEDVSDAQPVESATTKQPAEPATVKQPAEPAAVKQPSRPESDVATQPADVPPATQGGGKVVVAVGRALLKGAGITVPSDGPDEAPAFGP